MKFTTQLCATTACAVLMFATAPLAADDHTEADADPVALVAAQQDRTARVAQALWDFAEVGYLETRSTGLMQAELSGEGFKITPGIAEIPTAFVAEWGTGGPVIAILAEMDALPGINQSGAATRDPVDGKGAGHACGHNLFGAGSLTAAIAVKDWLEKTGTPGRIRLYGTPAEEGGSGKVYMTRAGMFDDVDIAIHWHGDDENSAAARTTLANWSANSALPEYLPMRRVPPNAGAARSTGWRP